MLHKLFPQIINKFLLSFSFQVRDSTFTNFKLNTDKNKTVSFTIKEKKNRQKNIMSLKLILTYLYSCTHEYTLKLFQFSS